jgi:hypothetical protein
MLLIHPSYFWVDTATCDVTQTQEKIGRLLKSFSWLITLSPGGIKKPPNMAEREKF